MKRVRLLSLVLAVLYLMGLMASCNQIGENTDSPAAETEASLLPTAGQAAAGQGTPGQPTDGEPASTSPEAIGGVGPTASSLYDGLYAYTLPLTTEEVSFTYFCTMSPMWASYMDSYDDNDSVLALKEMTGASISYQAYIPENAQIQFALMVASGEYADFIKGGIDMYTGGMDAAVDDDIFIDLSRYLDMCPNYSYLLNADPSFKRDLITDGGNLSGFLAYKEASIVGAKTSGAAIRGDWLNTLGLDVPTTYDELHDVLTAFKNELGVSYPMTVSSYMDDRWSKSLSSGFDTNAFFTMSPGLSVPIYVKDGEVKFSMMEDSYLEYLTLICTWYSEGLINENIESITNETTYADDVYNGRTGYFTDQIDRLELLGASCVDEGAYFVMTPAMRKTAGQTLHFNSTGYNPADSTQITTACSNIELACKWFDFHYGEECSMLSMYGVNGLTYTYGADGEPKYTDLIVNNPDFSEMVAKAMFVLPDEVAYITINTAISTYTEAQRDAFAVINSGNSDSEYVYPSGATMMIGEDERFRALFGDIGTYIQENVIKFVKGDRPLSEYDDFKAQLKDIGIDECISLYQAAYDRYLLR